LKPSAIIAEDLAARTVATGIRTSRNVRIAKGGRSDAGAAADALGGMTTFAAAHFGAARRSQRGQARHPCLPTPDPCRDGKIRTFRYDQQTCGASK
jgi:hypothetical protein